MKKLFMALSAATLLCLLTFPVQAARLDGHDGMMKITSANIMAYQNSNLTGQLNHYIVAGDWYNIIGSGSGSVQLHYPITIANGKGDATETHYFNFSDWAANCDGTAGMFSEGWNQTAWYNALPHSGVTYTDNCPDNNPQLYVSNNTGFNIVAGQNGNSKLLCGGVTVLGPTSAPATKCYYAPADWLDADWGWVQKSQAWSTTGLIQGTNKVYCAGSDASGNYATTSFTFKYDNVAPYCTSTAIKNVSPTGYDVYVYGVADATSGVKKVMVPTWTTPNQSDIQWLQATNQGGGTYMCHVSSSSFGGATKGYTSDVYIYDNAGNWGRYHTNTSNLTPPAGNPSYYPTADFEATSPVLLSQTITYTDLSTSGSSSDTIDQEAWSYSSDNQATWSSDASTPPSCFFSTGTYFVRLRVHDKSENIWSDYCIREIDVYSTAVAPIASFTVDSPVATNAFVGYHDTSHVDPSTSSWDSIAGEEWSWSTDGINWSPATSFPRMTFDLSEFPSTTLYATYHLRLRAKDAGNEFSPGVWSAYCYQDLVVYRPNTPPTALFNVNTPYSIVDDSSKKVGNIFLGASHLFTSLSGNLSYLPLDNSTYMPAGVNTDNVKDAVEDSNCLFVLKTDGELSAFNTNAGDYIDSTILRSDVTSIAISSNQILYVSTADGNVYYLNYTNYNSLASSTWYQIAVSNISSVITCPGEGTCYAITSDGDVYKWYDGSAKWPKMTSGGIIAQADSWYGAADYYTPPYNAKHYPAFTPFQVSQLKNITEISTGSEAAMALDKDGNVFLWGCDSYSGLGVLTGYGSNGQIINNIWYYPHNRDPYSIVGFGHVKYVFTSGNMLYLVDSNGEMESSDIFGHYEINNETFDYQDTSYDYYQYESGADLFGFASKQAKVISSNTFYKTGLMNVTQMVGNDLQIYALTSDKEILFWGKSAMPTGNSGDIPVDTPNGRFVTTPTTLAYYSTSYPTAVYPDSDSVLVQMSNGSYLAWGLNTEGNLGVGLEDGTWTAVTPNGYALPYTSNPYECTYYNNLKTLCRTTGGTLLTDGQDLYYVGYGDHGEYGGADDVAPRKLDFNLDPSTIRSVCSMTTYNSWSKVTYPEFVLLRTDGSIDILAYLTRHYKDNIDTNGDTLFSYSDIDIHIQAPLKSIKSIATIGNKLFFSTADGSVYSMDNFSYCLGFGFVTGTNYATSPNNPSLWYIGSNSSYAIDGFNTPTRLVTPNSSSYVSGPTTVNAQYTGTVNRVSGFSNVSQLYNSSGQLISLNNDGSITAASINSSGVLGTTATTGSNIKQIAANIASGNILALDNSGAVYAFDSSNGLTEITGLPYSSYIAVTSSSYYVISKDGTLFSWGDNTYGELGNGTTITSSGPTAIPYFSYGYGIPSVFPQDEISYSELASANDYWDHLTSDTWQWSWDNVNWQSGKPAQFSWADLQGQKHRILYIREQVSDAGNPPYSPGLTSKWYVQRLALIDPRPDNGTLSVTQYDYQQDITDYWVKPSSTIGIYSDGSFPSSFLFSPTRNYVGFGQDGAYIDSSSALQYADTVNHYSSGTDYDTYFNFIDDGGHAVSTGNLLYTYQNISGKKDATSFELYYNTSFIDTLSGKEYSSQEGYRNSGLWVHVDGRAPTGSAVITLANNTASAVVSNVSDNGGSGTKILYAEIYDNSSGAKTNLQTVNLTTSDGGATWTLPATSTAAIGSMANIEIDIYAEDNVGNIGMIGTFKNGSMTSGNLTGTLVLSNHYYENTDVTGAVNVAYTNTNPTANLTPSSGVTVRITAGSQVITKAVLCPANNTSYIPFTFHTPSVPAGSSQPLTVSVRIDPDHVMPETDYADNNVSQQVTIDSAAYTEPPATTYQPDVPSTFQNISPGNYPSTNSFTWQEWRFENSTLVLKTFSINVSSAMQLAPDSRIGSNKLGSDGIWTIRSGYGFGDTTTVHVTTNYDQPDLITLPQRIRVYFPEFNYNMQNNLRELEKVSQSGTASDYTVTYQFKQNPQSDILARLHFTPLWFPNGAYAVLENVRDLWTPAGQINMWGASQLNISGSVYDDWFTGLIRNQT